MRMLSAAVSKEGGGNASKTPNQALCTPTKEVQSRPTGSCSPFAAGIDNNSLDPDSNARGERV